MAVSFVGGELAGRAEDLHDLSVYFVVFEVAHLKALQLSPRLQQLLAQLLQLVLFLAHLFALSLDLPLQLSVLALQSIGLLDQLLDIALDFCHLVVYEPHVAFLLLVLCDHLAKGLHLLEVGGLHLADHLQNDLAALCVSTALLDNHHLVVLSDAF